MTVTKPPNRVARTIVGATRRLERRTTLLGLGVAAVGLLLGWIAWSSVNGVPLQDRYEISAIVPRTSPILKEGDAVRIAGRLGGLITAVEPDEENVRVEMELEPGFAPVGEDARTNVRVKSIIYITYLEIYPGDTSKPLPEGGTIPVERSGSGVDLLEVTQLFDREARRTLSAATYNLGVGVAGRGRELNAALGDVKPTAEGLRSGLEAATSTPGAISESIRGLGATTRGLRGERPDDVAAGIASGSAVLGAVARRDDELGQALELLRPFSDELRATSPDARAFLDEVTRLTAALDPAVADLAVLLPAVNRVLGLGDVLRDETVRLTAAINPFLRAAAPVLVTLRPTVASIEPLLAALDELVAGLDPYAEEIRLSSEGLISATETRYPEGATAPDTSALRFTPVLTCHKPRHPYPGPGETREHSQSC
jgi:ABC-type transporter Mla subunit MlaD